MPSNATPERLAASQAFAATSTRGRHLIIENSTHFIQLDNPEAVVEALLGVLEQLRNH